MGLKYFLGLMKNRIILEVFFNRKNYKEWSYFAKMAVGGIKLLRCIDDPKYKIGKLKTF